MIHGVEFIRQSVKINLQASKTNTQDITSLWKVLRQF